MLSQFEALKAQYPQLVAYPQAQGMKLAAGWLIEQAGWKGQSLGQAGVYHKASFGIG
jgi:UDP-N-acetylmuramate dehydrogenase